MKKSVFRNYIYNIIYQLLILIVPFLVMPHISRTLGADGIGMYGYSNSVTQYFILLGCAGLNLYGQRESAYCQDNIEKRSTVFFELFCIRIFCLMVSLLIFLFTVCNSTKYGTIFQIQTLEFFAAILDISWFFQGMEEFKKIVIRNSIVKVLGAVCIFIFVASPEDIWKYTLIYALSNFIGNISVWLYLPNYLIKVKFKDLKFKRHIRMILLLFVPQIATSIYNLLDKSMIGWLTKNDSEVAFYEQAQKIMKTALAIPTALGTVMMPKIASLYKKSEKNQIIEYLKKSFHIICIIAFPLCFGMIGISKTFIPWFLGNGYDKSVWNLIILSPIIVIVSFSNIVGVQFLLPVGRHKTYTISVVAGTIVNFLLNLILIPVFFSIGAAIASVCAEILVAVFQLWSIRNDFTIQGKLKKYYQYIFASIIMYFAIFFVDFIFKKPSATAVFLKVVGGGIVYFSVLFMMKDKFLLNGLRKVTEQLFQKKLR